MPQRIWRYPCCGHAGGSPKCMSCGKPGQYDGWHFGMYESMGRYQNMYGLRPMGPHRPLADELFDNTSRACVTCKGRGLLTVSANDSWMLCPDCRGMGHVWTISPERIKALRQMVLDAFPDAGVETSVDLFSGVTAFNLETSVIECLKDDDSEPKAT